MSEQTCINYLSKIVEIKTLCNDYNTTKIQLETALNELNAIESIFENELAIMNIPITMQHLDVYLLARIEMCRKSTVHDSLLQLRKTRTERINELNIGGADYISVMVPFDDESKNITNYVNVCIDGCNCMKERKNIIKGNGRPF